MSPTLIIFSSTHALPIAAGIKKNLQDTCTAHLWKEDYFGDNTATPLWTFFKRLFCYDYAVLVLADDQIVEDKTGVQLQERWVPKDNVIFELGAVMARLGPQKSFILTPDKPKVHLPSYFDTATPIIIEYDSQYVEKEEFEKATRHACDIIRDKLQVVDKNTFHSDLPAQGIAFGYLTNFVLPVYNGNQEQEQEINQRRVLWKAENGLTITIVIPDAIMGRKDADHLLLNIHNCFNTQFKLTEQRDMSVYCMERKTGSPLNIIDIPTTLLTSSNIIERIELFWRAKDAESVKSEDKAFKQDITARELLNFTRMLNELVDTKSLNRQALFIIQSSELPSHIEFLKSYNPPQR